MTILLTTLALVFGLGLQLDGVPQALVLLVFFMPFVWGLGILAAAITLTFRRGAGVVGLGVAALTLVSGLYFPVGLLPGWLTAAAQANPLAIAAEALREALLGGADWSAIGPDILILDAALAALVPRSARSRSGSRSGASAGSERWGRIEHGASRSAICCHHRPRSSTTRRSGNASTRWCERAPRESDLRFHGLEQVALAKSPRCRCRAPRRRTDCDRDLADRAARAPARARRRRRAGGADEGPRGRAVVARPADAPVPGSRRPRRGLGGDVADAARGRIRADRRSGALPRHPPPSAARLARAAARRRGPPRAEVDRGQDAADGGAAAHRGPVGDRNPRAARARARTPRGRTRRARVGARAARPAGPSRRRRSRSRREPTATSWRAIARAWDVERLWRTTQATIDSLFGDRRRPLVGQRLGAAPVGRSRANGARAAPRAVARPVLGAAARAGSRSARAGISRTSSRWRTARRALQMIRRSARAAADAFKRQSDHDSQTAAKQAEEGE